MKKERGGEGKERAIQAVAEKDRSCFESEEVHVF